MSEFDNARTYLNSIRETEIPTIDIPGLTSVDDYKNQLENNFEYVVDESSYSYKAGEKYYDTDNIIYLGKDDINFTYDDTYIDVNCDNIICFATNDNYNIQISSHENDNVEITYPSISLIDGNVLYTDGSIKFTARFSANVKVYSSNDGSESEYDEIEYHLTWEKDINVTLKIEHKEWVKDSAEWNNKYDEDINNVTFNITFKREEDDKKITLPLESYDDSDSDSDEQINGIYIHKRDFVNGGENIRIINDWEFHADKNNHWLSKNRYLSVTVGCIIDGCLLTYNDDETIEIKKEEGKHDYTSYRYKQSNNKYGYSWYKKCVNGIGGEICNHEVEITKDIVYYKKSEEKDETNHTITITYDIYYNDERIINEFEITSKYYVIPDDDTIVDKLSNVNLKNFLDSNYGGIDAEYDYMLENYNSSLYDVNIVPVISSFGYVDGSDGLGNPYRLNASKIFGKNNLSPNLIKSSCDYQEHAFDMPYFLIDATKKNEYDGTTDMYFLSNSGYNPNDDKKYVYLNEDDKNYFGSETPHISSMSIENFSDFLNDLTNNSDNVFEKLFMSNDKCKYSTFKYNSVNNSAETLFSGVKFCVNKLYVNNDEEKEVNAKELDGVKFTFLYVPVLLTKDNITNYALKVVYNKKCKYIVGIRTISMIDEKDYDTIYLASGVGEQEDNQVYIDGRLFRTKMYMMDKITCVKKTSNQKNNDNDKIILKFQNVSTSQSSNENLYYVVSDEKLYIKYSTRTINEMFKKYSSLSAIDDSTWIGKDVIMRFYTKDGKRFTCKNIGGEDGYYNIVFKDGFMIISLVNGNNVLNNINDFSNIEITLNESDIFESVYSGTYDDYTMSGIRKSLESKNVDYIYSDKHDDNYKIKLHVEEPETLYTYDIIQPVIESLMTSKGENIISGYTLGLKHINESSLESINRYSGYYEPIANDVLFFKSSKDFDSYDKVYIDYDYESSANNFGIMRNVCFHKSSINEHMLNQDNPIYPMIGECALDYRDMNIFSSSWDDDYYVQYTKPNEAYYDYGTRGMKNNKSFMGGKYVNLPDSISFVGLNNMIEWDDRYISNPYLINDEGMYHEVNNSSVEFYLMIEKRLIRFLKEKLRPEFEKYINVEYGFGNVESIDDDIEEYIKLNILKLYEIEEVKLWVRDESSSLHNGDIENDYTGYMNYDSENDYKKFGMKMTNGFQMKNLTNNNFDRKITYNMKSGKKEYFGFSFKIKKL